MGVVRPGDYIRRDQAADGPTAEAVVEGEAEGAPTESRRWRIKDKENLPFIDPSECDAQVKKSTGEPNMRALFCNLRDGPSGRVGIMVAMLLAGLGSPLDAGSIFDDDWVPPKPSASPPVAMPPAPPSALSAHTRPALPPPAAAPSAGQETAPRPPSRSAPAKRLRIPAKADQGKSRKLMQEIFAKRLSDHSVQARSKLGEELLSSAAKASDNPVDQFVLLGGAITASTLR